jgi:hypothetical protein
VKSVALVFVKIFLLKIVEEISMGISFSYVDTKIMEWDLIEWIATVERGALNRKLQEHIRRGEQPVQGC